MYEGANGDKVSRAREVARRLDAKKEAKRRTTEEKKELKNSNKF